MTNSCNEYDSPEVYEAEYGQCDKDIAFFLQHASGKTALDLACGTGRLTIPLAKKGFLVIALDASDAMLAFARKKTEVLPIQWVKGDMREFVFPQTFDLITLTGNSFQALLSEEDQLRMLVCVNKNLTPGGRFVFNARNPQADDFYTTSEFSFWHTFQDATGETLEVYGRQEADQPLITYHTKRVWKDREIFPISII